MLAFPHIIQNGRNCNYSRTSCDTSPGCGSGTFQGIHCSKEDASGNSALFVNLPGGGVKHLHHLAIGAETIFVDVKRGQDLQAFAAIFDRLH